MQCKVAASTFVLFCLLMLCLRLLGIPTDPSRVAAGSSPPLCSFIGSTPIRVQTASR